MTAAWSIVHFTELESPFLNGEVEVDESYFGGVRKGLQGRGASGKIPVFGCLERNRRRYRNRVRIGFQGLEKRNFDFSIKNMYQRMGWF